MRILCTVFLAFFIFAGSAQAFLYDITMYSSTAIMEMTDAQIMDVYVEAKIEERASAEFHEAAGFSNAKEYQQRKDLLRYIILLRKEMQKRGIEPDPISDWLK